MDSDTTTHVHAYEILYAHGHDLYSTLMITVQHANVIYALYDLLSSKGIPI